MHEILLEVDPAAVLDQLDPRFDGRVGHRQDGHALDAEALREFTGDPTRRPAGMEQLGAPQVSRQVLVAQPKPGFGWATRTWRLTCGAPSCSMPAGRRVGSPVNSRSASASR